MSASPPCPGFECWETLLDEAAPANERQRYEQHLEECRDCQARLDGVEELPEGLRRVGRQVGDPTRTPLDPTLARMLERLLGDKPADRPAAAADLYFLRPTGREDLLGTLGEYEVTGVIGEGGMGIVLKAYEPALHRHVAIKVLAPALAGSAAARLRFTREARAAAAVCHDHIVAVHGVHEIDGLPYLVMQYVAGESLQERLDRCGILEAEEVVRIGLQTAAGLAAAHAQGLIHRDIKPANLLLENGLSRVKITDFGLARSIDDVRLTQSGVVSGTPEYMAPEQARAEPVDHRADLFSLGSVLYTLCAGRRPFRGSTPLAVLRAVCDEEPPALRRVNPNVPEWLERFIAHLMAKDPADRFPTAAEVAGLLEGYLAHLRQPVSVPAPPLPPDPGKRGQPQRPDGRRSPGPAARRFRWALGATAAVVLLSLLALGLAALRQGVPWAGQAPKAPPPRTDYPEDFHPVLKGNTGEVPGLVVYGPDAADCVNFKPDGIRITLPATFPRQRPGTGVITDFGVRGDFEITVSYEILQEPSPRPDGGNPTELRLVAVPNEYPRPGMWHRADQNRALLTRQAATLPRTAVVLPPEDQRLAGIPEPRQGVPTGHFLADWVRWNNEDLPRDQWGNEQFNQIELHNPMRSDTTAKVGRLRLIRSGPTLFFCTSEGSHKDFTLLHTAEFGTTDLKNVRILGSTGWEGNFFDVRITDLRVRAEALVKAGAESPPRAPPAARRWWLAGALALLVLSAAVAVSLGAWQYTRTRRRASAPRTVPGAAAAIAFVCSGCGKRLRARTEQAGRKLRCPQCRQGVFVPEARPLKPEELP